MFTSGVCTRGVCEGVCTRCSVFASGVCREGVSEGCVRVCSGSVRGCVVCVRVCEGV